MTSLRRLGALVFALALVAGAARAQTIPSSTFSGLPGSPTPGQLQWITDGGGTPVPGTAAIGGGTHKDLVSYDASQTRWEFVLRAPDGTSDADIPTLLDAVRIAFDGTSAGSASTDVQEALEELFAGGGGGGGGGSTNLSKTATATTVTVASDTGTDAVLVGASQSLAGLQTAADKLGFDLATAAIHYANPATIGTTTAGIAEAIAACGAGVGGGSVSPGCVVQAACDVGSGGRTITSTIVVGGDTLATAKSGVLINGCGPGYQNGAGQQTAGTALVWNGAIGANMVEFRTCNHCGISNLALDANGIAARHLFYDSVSGWPTGHHRAFNLQLQDSIGSEAIYLADSSQIDNGIWDHVSMRDVVGCFRQTYSQSVNNELTHAECSASGPTPIKVDSGELKIRESFLSLTTTGQKMVSVGADAILLAEGNSLEFKAGSQWGFWADASGSSGGANDTSRIVGNRFVLLGAAGNNGCVSWNKQGHLSFLDNQIIGINAGADLGCDLVGDNSADADLLYVRSEGNSHRNVFVAGEFPNGVIDYGVVPWQTTSKVVLEQLANVGRANPGGVNHSSGLVDWTQLKGVPAGFADGSDDGSSGGATDLNGLTDVTLTVPATGATLIYNGSQWIDGQLDLADLDAVTGVLADANVSDTITASNYCPLTGCTFSGNVSLLPSVQLLAGSGSLIGPSGIGIVQANQFVGSGSLSASVDLATAEVSGIAQMANGGSGASSFTSGGIILGTGSLALHATPVLTAGQILIGDGTTDPTIAALSGDATMTSGGVVSLSTNSVDANELVSTGVSAGTYQAPTVTIDGDGRITSAVQGTNLLIGSGTKALSTGAIAAGACNTDTITATGVVSTDSVAWSPNADLSVVTGYRPISGDGLAIYPPVPSANLITVKVCNPTASSITPGAVTLNWRVAR